VTLRAAGVTGEGVADLQKAVPRVKVNVRDR
jgi:hypothetical protein